MAYSNLAQLTFEYLDTYDRYLDAVEAHAPKLPKQRDALLPLAAELLRAQTNMAPPTHAQVYHWRELAGALTLLGTAGMSDDGWPEDLSPTQATLKSLVERRVIVRRGRAWHLRRDWYTRLAALRQIAVETPVLSEVERPASDLPSYAELKGFEAICCYLDAQPKSRARLPFDGMLVSEHSVEGNVPITALRQMRHYRLVRHTSSCAWALSPKWQERLKLLWRGVNTALRDYQPPQLAPSFPRSLVAGIDTWHLNWLVEHPLPASLRERLDRWQEQAREEEAEIETDLQYDDVPLVMYRWGTKAEKGREGKGGAGVSWGYVLLNRSLRLLIRKSPLGGIVAQARLGSECLWRRTPKQALDELTLLMKRLWQGQKGSWQVSQVHLCHDVANVPLTLDLLSRFVSRSRNRAAFEAAQAEVQRITQARYGQLGDDADHLLLAGIDWGAEFADDEPLNAFSPFSPFDDVFADGTVDSWGPGSRSAGGVGSGEASAQEETPVEERASSVYHYGKRLSGLTFSPGGAISVAIYLKRLESLLRRKVHMFPLWKAAGWNEEDEVTRVEARLRRDALRELRLPGIERASLDDPYELLNHLEAVFALVVGRLDECPDAINSAWVRLVVPREGESNRSRWDTDPAWRVVQSSTFTPAPVAARRIIRRKQRAHDVQHLVSGSYGYLVSFITEQFPAGELWDVSRAVRGLAEAWEHEAAKPGKDFGELVRERRKERGLSVLPRQEVLPALSALPATMRLPTASETSESLESPATPEAQVQPEMSQGVGGSLVIPEGDTPLLPWEEERREQRPLLRVLSAKRRLEEAAERLQLAEWQQEPDHRLAWYRSQAQQEQATYTVVRQHYLTLLEQRMFHALQALEGAEQRQEEEDALAHYEVRYQEELAIYSTAFEILSSPTTHLSSTDEVGYTTR